MEATAYLCSSVTCPHPRDPVVTNREGIILIIVARRHCHVLHVGSWKLPLESKHHCGLVGLKIFYSVDWTRDPWIRVDCKMRQLKNVRRLRNFLHLYINLVNNFFILCDI